MTTEQQVFDLARKQVTDLLTDEELRYTIKVIITAHKAVLEAEFMSLATSILPQPQSQDTEADMYEVFSQQYY